MSQYDDGYMQRVTSQQHLKLHLWKSSATLRLIWKKTLLIKDTFYSTNKIFKLLQNLFFIYLFIYLFICQLFLITRLYQWPAKWNKFNTDIFFHNEAALSNTAQKMKFSIKDFFSRCDQIRSFLRIWSHLLKKLLMENFMFCLVKSICQMSILNGTWEYF